MAPKKGNKTQQNQTGKKDKGEVSNRNTIGAQPIKTADIKEFFQQLQPQSPHAIQELQTSQESSNLAQSSVKSRSSGEE